MKLAALVSGGKDSWLAVERLVGEHEIEYLVCVEPEPDSKLLHSYNLDVVKLQSETSGIPLIWGESDTEGAEALRDALERVSEKIEGVVSGAIASNYQREKVEGVCKNLDLDCLFPLWSAEEEELMEELLDKGFEVVVTKVGAQGLDEEWLDRKLDKDALGELKELDEKYGVHVSGEGGEYETLVVDCCLFEEKIDVNKTRKNWDRRTKSGLLEVLDAGLG